MDPHTPALMAARGIEPELLVEGIRGAHLKPVILSAHTAPSQISRIWLPRAVLDFATLGPALQITGAMDRHCYTLIFVHSSPTPSRSLNFSLQHGPGLLGLFPPGGEVDAVTAPGFGNGTLTIPVAVFHEAVTRWFPGMPERYLRSGVAVRVGAAEQARLRELFALLDPPRADLVESLGHPAAVRHLEQELLAAFVAALRSGLTTPSAPFTARPGDRFFRLRSARDFLAAHAHTPLYLDDLSAALGLSERGVEKLFREMVGLSPLAYLRHHRLHGVRRSLLQADPAPGVVKQIALDWGFWHLGHFARDYRLLFHESPSATLQRPRAPGRRESEAAPLCVAG